MKRVCIDARMLKSAGIGTYLISLLKNLKNTPYKISLIVNSKIVKEDKWLEVFDLIYLEADIYSIKEQIFLPFKIPKCDLFFSPHFNVPILPIRAKKRLSTIHDVYHLAFISSLRFFEKLYAKFVICKAALQSNAIITVSQFSKEEILKYTKAKEDKISVIYNAIDFDLFRKTDDEKQIESIKTKFNLPDNYFLFVGNLKPHKNLINLLKAFEEIEAEYKDQALVIIGKNKNLINSIDVKKIIKNKHALKNKIKIIDNAKTEDLPLIYQSAKALVFPSLYEGFGYPPLEAMACNCPVIVSKAASLPEICSDASIYIDPYNSQSIARAMKQIIEDKGLKKSLIQKASNRVKSFTMKTFIQKHLDQIESLL